MTRFVLIDEEGDTVLDAATPDWFGQAACASGGELLEDFFVEESHKNATEQTLAAKRWCAGCPVRTECLDWALMLEKRQIYREGIFGGLSASERTFAAQAPDPIAFGLGVLDEQVKLGMVTQPVILRMEVSVAVSIRPE
jgi:WhiB family redox-sensing transcriptional regulator